jgi:hypothetical protein
MGGNVGRIWANDGMLLHAETSHRVGTEAFHEMLGWTRASFRIDMVKFAGRPTMSAKLEAALLAGVTYLDEMKRLQERFGNAASLTVNEALGATAALDDQTALVLRLVEIHRDLHVTVANSPISVLKTMQALRTLADRGVIQAQGLDRESVPADDEGDFKVGMEADLDAPEEMAPLARDTLPSAVMRTASGLQRSPLTRLLSSSLISESDDAPNSGGALLVDAV